MTGLERGAAKTINFGKIYGIGIRSFATQLGKPLAEAQRIYEQYDRELPYISQLDKLCRRQACRQGYITLYDGARRHFDRFAPGGKWQKGAGPCSLEEAQERLKDPEHPWYRRGPLYRADIRTALNALIQGSAARHTKLWMRACWREGVVPLLQMHDCLDCSVSSREQAEVVARLGEEAVQLDLPMRVDVKFGRNWGNAKHSWEELHQSTSSAKTAATPAAIPTPKINGHTSPLVPTTTIAVPAATITHEEPETLDERLASIALADLIGERPLNGKIACPFHEDDTPSLHVYSDHYHCFGCGAHGGHLDWLREVEGLSADAAIDVIFHWRGRTFSPRRDDDARTLKLALALSRRCRPMSRCVSIRAAHSDPANGCLVCSRFIRTSRATSRPAFTASL
jgi:hypothetical protein